jgi:transcriptional regulator GlxA family with amidase domain
MKKIALFADNASSIPGVTGALEIFNIANILANIQNPGNAPFFDCTIVASGKKQATICKGLKVEFTTSLASYKQADAVVITGFLYRTIEDLLHTVKNSDKAISWLRQQYRYGAIIAGSCSGTVLLAESRLLNGKSATTSWWLTDLFRKMYPEINLQIDHLLLEDGRIITAGAVTSYSNLVLYLIEKFHSKELALSCAKTMLIDINRFSQASYKMLQTIADHKDNLVTRAQYWLNENFKNKIDMKNFSDALSVSYRTLIRRFKAATGDTPIQYLQKIRIESAKHLLEITDLNLDTIMERVGYSDPSAFSLLFKRLTRLTPREYRNQLSIYNRGRNRGKKRGQIVHS